MKMIEVPAASFSLGNDSGFWDEKPAHSVTITQTYKIAERPVFNAEYEQFDSAHRSYRGRNDTPAGDDDPVRFITWDEAQAYCVWRGHKEGRAYRLPTEAEWEHAFQTPGDQLLSGRDVENWCEDWYGPYPVEAQRDPIGYATGDARVVRGGTWQAPHGEAGPSPTARLGSLPGDRNPLVGLRLAEGPRSHSHPLTNRPQPRWAQDVSEHADAEKPFPDANAPYFAQPISYVHIPSDSHGPLFSKHNHDPGLCACANGDLLAIWYTCDDESGRELHVLGARLRRGAQTWDDPAVFWAVPGRDNHAPSLWQGARGTLYHFNGIAAGGGWQDLALLLRTSRDNGRTWTAARFLSSDYMHGNMPIPSVFRAENGTMYLPCDATPAPAGGTVLHVSRDGGWTWVRLDNRGEGPETFASDGVGPWIAGIHAGVVPLSDGSLVAVGRGDTIDGQLAMSRSTNGGLSWHYSATLFPPIGGGQRVVLRRLNEGPLLLISFTSGSEFVGTDGKPFTGHGMFAALSHDGGHTWPVQKLLTDGVTRTLDGRGWTHEFTMDATHAEPAGYLAGTQTPDGRIHLISSGIYYCFSYAWLVTASR